MRYTILALGLVAVTGVTLSAELYRVTVTRIDKDLYRVDSTNQKRYIETRYCYEYATQDDAVLRYERYSYDNKLIFSNGQMCDVKEIR